MANLSFHFVITFLFLLRHFSATSDISELFEIWCTEHGKSYSSAEEKLYRLGVFADNYEFVTHHNNQGNSSYTLSLNAYADITHHEFKAARLGLSSALRSSRPVSPQEPYLHRDVPESLDWRKKGAVTAVKDQGSCGACWSFSATGAIEGINQIRTGSLISVSEQELIDCDRSYNSGCGGGLMDYAYQFVIKNHGIDTEDDYPFQGRDGSCHKDKLNRKVVTIDGYSDVPPNNEEKLLQAVAIQPVSVGICGSERAFQLYSKGIFSGPCSTSLDHAVLIVGYGSENGVDYWIVKNSWGKRWGMDGYIHMQRNSGNSEGVCGINMLASYPTKTSPNPPPSPPPGPTKCSFLTSCAAGETCCCAKEFFGLCLSWKCCGLSSAVCCKDGRHCCPFDYPICDTQRNLCLKRTMNGTRTEALENRSPSGTSGSWSSS
ncbi:zingipain-2 [Cucurbita moschata]|uniref:Zingipain-2 n=1 Tax=Cucurbita moschata TaxID=3662 RepID=A0A6J1GH92_CUCMO|nr:zingipain-2 [Cucurbita moschata]